MESSFLQQEGYKDAFVILEQAKGEMVTCGWKHNNIGT